jgi:hypothetical protein
MSTDQERQSHQCHLYLELNPAMEELLESSTKEMLNQQNALSIHLQDDFVHVIELDHYREAFCRRKLVFQTMIELMKPMCCLLTGYDSLVKVKLLSSRINNEHSIVVSDVRRGTNSVLSSVGDTAELKHGSILTLFSFPSCHVIDDDPTFIFNIFLSRNSATSRHCSISSKTDGTMLKMLLLIKKTL